MCKYLGVLLFLSVLFSGVFAEAKNTNTKELRLSVYNHGQALVNEVRTLKIPKGESRLEYVDVPQTIKPETLQIKSLSSPESFFVLDMNYEYDLINVKNILNKYIGENVRITMPDNDNLDKNKIVKARLLSNNDRPIFEVDGDIYIGNYESLYLADMPKGLRANPALVWLVDNRGAKKQDISVSYLTEGISWDADYVLKLDSNQTKASLVGWVSLVNSSGKTFTNASLKLVAGDVNTVDNHVEFAYGARKSRAVLAMAESDMREEEFFEYHLYSLDRKVDIANNQTKQVRLLGAEGIKVEKKLEAFFNGYPNRNSGKIKQKADVFLLFKNIKSNHLGVPLPKGVVRAYQESSDGSMLFIGEDKIDHTASSETVKLKVGQAFDIKIERILKDYEKIDRNVLKYTWEIKIRNGKDVPQQLVLKDYMRGDWDITASSIDYKKIDSNHIEIAVNVLPSKEKDVLVIEYSVISKV